MLPFLSAIMLKALGWQISQFNNPGQITLSLVWQGFAVLAILFVAQRRDRLVLAARSAGLIAAGIFWAIELLFFTTFLTNGQGIGTGLIGSLGYWIDQQEVMRGGQPWYYFWVLVPLYEFLPLVLSIGGHRGVVASWLADKETRKQDARQTRRHGDEETEGARRAKKGARSAANATLPHSDTPIPVLSVQRIFEAFLVFWALATWAVFTYVGEKMAVACGLLRHFDGAAGRAGGLGGLRRDRLGRRGASAAASG